MNLILKVLLFITFAIIPAYLIYSHWQKEKCDAFQKEFFHFSDSTSTELGERLSHLSGQMDEWEASSEETKLAKRKDVEDLANQSIVWLDSYKAEMLEWYNSDCFGNSDFGHKMTHAFVEELKDSIKINMIGRLKHSNESPPKPPANH